MKYTPQQREMIIRQAAGKVVEELEWDEVDAYWWMRFTDGTEIAFRFMSELIGTQS